MFRDQSRGRRSRSIGTKRRNGGTKDVILPPLLVAMVGLTLFLVLSYERSFLPVLDSEPENHPATESNPFFAARRGDSLLNDDYGCKDDESSLSDDGSETTPARLFFLVVAHNQRTLRDALYLFRAIRGPRNIILIHIDLKLKKQLDLEKSQANYVPPRLFQEVEDRPCGSIVRIESLFDASWGDWSMNLPTLWGIETAVNEYAGQWDVFLNLSGDTLPVYSRDVLARLFGGPLQKTNFITSSACETGLVPTPVTDFPKPWHKRQYYEDVGKHYIHYTDRKGMEHNETITVYFGSQWMALQADLCHNLVHELQRPDSLIRSYKDYMVETGKRFTDETFFPTLLVHEFPETLPQLNQDGALAAYPSMYSIRYERMDDDRPTRFGFVPLDQRYDVPSSFGETPNPWGPYYLGVYDLYNIRQSGALFVRKVSTSVDPNLYHLFPVDSIEEIPPIRWPKEVRVSGVPIWENFKAQHSHHHEAKSPKRYRHNGKTKYLEI